MSPGIEILPAAARDHAERAALWTDAFSDYYVPGSHTAESLAAFERAFDLDLDGSRLVVEDSRPVAFAMLGIRGERSWVGGMGVATSARRSGHGRRVMEALMASARERGLAALALEVLVENVRAIPLYEALGFRTIRRLDVWERAATVPAPELPEPAAVALSVEDSARRVDAWRATPLPWQRELRPSIAAFPDMQSVAIGSPPQALAIFRALPDRIGLLEVIGDPAFPGPDRDRALDAVLQTIFAAHPARVARLVNLPAGEAAGAALERAGATVTHQQWEMEISL